MLLLRADYILAGRVVGLLAVVGALAVVTFEPGATF